MPTITLEDYIAEARSMRMLQTAAARLTCAQGGSMGNWSLELQNVRILNALVTDQRPHGRVELASDGWLAIDLDDFQGWHPFIALAGLPAGRGNVRGRIRYGHDGTSTLETDFAANYDPALARYVVLGPLSDGTLAANGVRSRILFSVSDGSDWGFDDAWVGWVQTA